MSAAFRAAHTLGPQIVWIEGEPGIGKTALVRQFLSTVQGAFVLDASGDETEVTLEYGVVAQLISRATAVNGSGPPDPRTARPRQDVPPPSPGSVFSVGAELLALLGAQRPAPTVIAVDDAHWLDLASAGALLFALRRLQADRILVVVASRPDSLDRLGSSWPRLLNDADRVRRVRLSGLTGQDVSLMAKSLGYGSITFAAAERLREHTGGHPLYVKALLGELPPDALSFDDRPLPAPRSFAATVLARLTNISSDAQNLVAAAAVAGPRCRVTLAAAVIGLRDPFPAVAEALAADLLTLVPGRIPEEAAFTHPLVRAAVYDDLSPTRRRDLHLECAKLDSVSRSLAHRVAASHGSDDALAAELTVTAEGDMAAGSVAAGAEHLLWASRIAASPVLRDEALLRAAECLMLAGDVPAAHGLRDAVMSCRPGLRKSFVLGALTASTGRLIEAEAELRAVTAHPDFGLHVELVGQVSSSLAIVCAYLGKGDDAIAWAHQALDAQGNLPTAEVTARQALALGLTMSGRGREGIATLASLSASRSHPEPFEAELMATRGNLKAWCGDLPGAVEDLSAVIRWSRAGWPLRSLPNAYGSLAETEYRLGRWDDGLIHADLAVSLGEDTERAWDLAFVHGVASQLHAGRGNWSAATEHVEAARRAAELAPLPVCIYYACLAAGHLAWVRGDWDALLVSLEPLRELPTGSVMVGLGPPAAGLLEAEALLFARRPEEASRVLDELSEAGESASGVGRAEIWRLGGVLEYARGRPAEAQVAFDRAREAAKRAGSPPVQAALELTYGHFLRKTGSRRAAIAALHVARQLYEHLGAGPFLARCDAELAACGVRAQEHEAENHYGLTPREQVVARLVATGKSNREIAAELYLSIKAIEYHLGNIFAKVGVRSRHQVASRLADPDAPSALGATRRAHADLELP